MSPASTKEAPEITIVDHLTSQGGWEAAGAGEHDRLPTGISKVTVGHTVEAPQRQPAIEACHLSGRLNHELLAGVIGHTRDVDAPTAQVDEEEDINLLQTQERPDLGREEVGRDDLVQFPDDKGLPGMSPLSLRTSGQAIALQHSRDGSDSDSNAELLELTMDAQLPPTGIVTCHPKDQALCRRSDLRPSSPGSAGEASTLQGSSPAPDRPMAGDGGDLLELRPSKPMAQFAKRPTPFSFEAVPATLRHLASAVVQLCSGIGQLVDEGSVLPANELQENQDQWTWTQHGQMAQRAGADRSGFSDCSTMPNKAVEALT